jgi:hypothetical protein
MEHERGAFKVKPAYRSARLRNGRKFTSSIPRLARRLLLREKYRAFFLIKFFHEPKKHARCR